MLRNCRHSKYKTISASKPSSDWWQCSTDALPVNRMTLNDPTVFAQGLMHSLPSLSDAINLPVVCHDWRQL